MEVFENGSKDIGKKLNATLTILIRSLTLKALQFKEQDLVVAFLIALFHAILSAYIKSSASV